jgi:hypothetical protein
MTNKEIVLDINEKIKAATRLYFDNMNSGVSYISKEGDTYEVPGVGVLEVKINLLSNNNGNLKISDISETVFKRKAVQPLVRVKVSLDTVLSEWILNPSYMKASIMGIINSVQKAWEKEFGSYKNQRFGNVFFDMKDIVYNDNDDNIYIDFYGDWASSKDE